MDSESSLLLYEIFNDIQRSILKDIGYATNDNINKIVYLSLPMLEQLGRNQKQLEIVNSKLDVLFDLLSKDK